MDDSLGTVEPSTETSPSPGAAICAVHEAMHASGTCERCGNFVCVLCLEPFGPLPGYCEACRERGGGGAIAWERDEGGWWSRWWQTTRDVIFRSRDTFASVRPGSVGAALGYVTVTGALIGVVVSALLGCMIGVMGMAGIFDEIAGADLGGPALAGITVAVVLLYPVMVVLGMLISVGIRTLIYHGAVAMMRGTGGFGASFWTVCYLHAIQLAMLPLAVLQQIPFIGPLIGLAGYGAMETFMAFQLTHCARDYHGLEGGRAAFAGWSAFIVAAVLGVTCCLAAGIALYSANLQ